MHTCGMDTLSGEWAFSIGFAATHTRGGCILAVVPGVMGICTLSPEVSKDNVSALFVSFSHLGEPYFHEFYVPVIETITY